MTVRHIDVPGLGPLALTLSVDQAAELANWGRDSTYAAIERGEVRAIRVGRSIKVLTIPLLEQLGFSLEPATHSSRVVHTNDEAPPASGASESTPTRTDKQDDPTSGRLGAPAHLRSAG